MNDSQFSDLNYGVAGGIIYEAGLDRERTGFFDYCFVWSCCVWLAGWLGGMTG